MGYSAHWVSLLALDLIFNTTDCKTWTHWTVTVYKIKILTESH